MATEVTTRLRDDIDGSVADRTVSFTWDGAQYDIDLSKKNAAELEAALAPYVAAGRRTGGRAVAARGRKAAGKPSKAVTRTRKATSAGTATDLGAVRAWAAANGHAVAARGRISASVLDAFHAGASSSNGTAAKPAKRTAAKPATRRRPVKRATKAAAKRAGRPARAAAVEESVSA
jgi:hypothetical protein